MSDEGKMTGAEALGKELITSTLTSYRQLVNEAAKVAGATTTLRLETARQGLEVMLTDVLDAIRDVDLRLHEQNQGVLQVFDANKQVDLMAKITQKWESE
jgi:hypothetical protein